MKKSQPALWQCPKCGQKFVTPNMWHSCVVLTLDDFFKGKDPKLKKLYRSFLKLVREFGPVTVNVNKTRISFQTRVRFAGVAGTRRDGLVCGFWLKRKIESPRFTKVQLLPPRDYVYQFLLTDEKQLDSEVRSWIKEAYRVGKQEVR